MSDDRFDNTVNLDVSVSEQIADMQLMYLRQAALNRVLSFDEIKTLEILSKVKNAEIEKRTPKQEEDPKKTRAKKLGALAQTNLISLPESKENETNSAVPEPKGTSEDKSKVS